MTDKSFPATRKPRVAFVFARRGKSENSTLYGGFVKRMQKNGLLKNVVVEYFALEELIFRITDSEAYIYQEGKTFELSDFDYVYIKSWSSVPDRAAALANYLEAKGIPYGDTLLLGKGTSKLTTHFRLWGEGISVIPSIFGKPTQLTTIVSKLKYPAVIKSVNGQKGKDNYLVESKSDALKLLSDIPADDDYVVQPMIKNDGDLRLQVYGYRTRLIMKRVGKGDTHLNNTSAGGEATLMNIEDCPIDIIDLAEKAAKSMQLEVCGVDAIKDSSTGTIYIMEVNQGSQIVTGLYSTENMKAFDEYIEQKALTRYIRNQRKNKRLGIVGRHEYASLPGLGIDTLHAKVDTGAHVSSLHAENIQEIIVDGMKKLRFEIPTDTERKVHEVADYGEINIRNAHGVTKRYTIVTPIMVRGLCVTTRLNLSNRGELKFPLLLGRKFLRGRFLVNVEISLKASEL